MSQYRISETTEIRLRKFLQTKRPGTMWQTRAGNPKEYGNALTFDDAVQELLTAAGF